MVKIAEAAGWWVEVDGVVLPAPIAGHPALELCNTWAGWSDAGRPTGDPERQDYLRSWQHLTTLALDRGLLGPEWRARLRRTDRQDPGLVTAVLGEARDLRGAAYRSLVQRADAADLARVARLATEARTCQRLEARPGRCTWVLETSAGARAPLLAVAAAVADLLTSGVDRVRACPGHGCGWLFVNHSGRRRWCQMAVCGNRAKVRSFAERHRDG